jgi:hypothetical protein
MRATALTLLLSAAAFTASGQQVQPSGPTTEVVSTNASTVSAIPTTVTTTKATLYIYRHRRYEGGALKPSVYVDETEVARMGNGRFVVAQLTPGHHSIRSNDRGSGVDIDMKSGTDYYIRVDMQTGFWKGHGRLSLILPEQGSYEVRQEKPLNENDVKDHDLMKSETRSLASSTPK